MTTLAPAATVTHTAALARFGHALSDPTGSASCSHCGKRPPFRPISPKHLGCPAR
jgi:hypothetical protein